MYVYSEIFFEEPNWWAKNCSILGIYNATYNGIYIYIHIMMGTIYNLSYPNKHGNKMGYAIMGNDFFGNFQLVIPEFLDW